MSCMKHVVRNFAPALLLGIVAWLYITYVLIFCVIHLQDHTKRLIYLIVVHILFVLFMWSFCQSARFERYQVPEKFFLNKEDYRHLQRSNNDQEADSFLRNIINKRNLTIYTRSDLGTIRYCRACRIIKPDRTHHCSTCGTCILKMDHHCPWINNCVGFFNHKAFVLMLFYSSIVNAFYVSTISTIYHKTLWNATSQEMVIIAAGVFVASAMGISSLLLGLYNLFGIFRNKTTLESMRDTVYYPDYLTFNVGCYENFCQVFGSNCCYWLFPIHTSTCNGYDWRVSSEF